MILIQQYTSKSVVADYKYTYVLHMYNKTWQTLSAFYEVNSMHLPQQKQSYNYNLPCWGSYFDNIFLPAKFANGQSSYYMFDKLYQLWKSCIVTKSIITWPI